MKQTDEQALATAVDEVRAFCLTHADPAIVKKYAKYFKEGYDGYGISKESWGSSVRKQLSDKHRAVLGLDGLLDLGDRLFASGKYEEGSFAIDLITPLLPEFRPETFQRIGGWLETGVQNWAHSDVICRDLLAPSLKSGALSCSELECWRKSPSRWRRRAVPVALLGLIGSAPTADLLGFVRPLMLDQERVVQQGLGWFLRELWKKDRQSVEEFLLEWKDTAPRLIFQYATEKMNPEEKARFRKSKA